MSNLKIELVNVVSIIDQACEEICNNYCKYTEQALASLDGEAEEPEACKHCPLDMLR